ncbi:hypothetical protein ACVILK_000761 [Bradyrhizobium embrapense]
MGKRRSALVAYVITLNFDLGTGRYMVPLMGRPILIKCPTSGLNVQCWMEDAPNERERDRGDYRGVFCPACELLHFVNGKTGKMLGQK